MKNSIKNTGLIILIAMFLTAGLTSCYEIIGRLILSNEKGGIIFVENKRAEKLYVHITDSNGRRNGIEYTKGFFIETAYPGKTEKFVVNINGTYWVYVNGIRYKDVFVSNGEEVYVTIDNETQ